MQSNTIQGLRKGKGNKGNQNTFGKEKRQRNNEITQIKGGESCGGTPLRSEKFHIFPQKCI